MSRFVLALSLAALTLSFFRPPSLLAAVTKEDADVDKNGYVNSGDLFLVAQGSHPRADVTRDGVVNSGDLLGVAINYGPVSATRDKYRQPFASTSIWNMPVGSAATYAPTAFAISRDYTVIDKDYWIVTSPSDPQHEIVDNHSHWNGPRCAATSPSGVLTRFPASLTISDVSDVYKPNNAAAILQPDGRTIVQLNALARCTPGGPVFGIPVAQADIYGPGRFGGHGGSGLSSIGGTVRRGELLAGDIKHVLKVNIPCALYCSPSSGPDGGPGWRWPASTSDRHCGGVACGYGGTLDYVQMGTLLALSPDLNINTITAPGQSWTPGMETEVGRRLFRAFQDYGAYVVDDLVWNGSAYALHVEPGVREEVLAQTGIDIDHSTASCGGACGAYWRDWHRIWLNLKAVTNNGPSSGGGGGAPRVPLAPPIGN